MVVEWTSPDRSPVRDLFEPHRRFRAVILPALEQGRGTLWVDSLEDPQVAWLSLSVFNIVAGDSSAEVSAQIIEKIPHMRVLVVPDEGWTSLTKSIWGDEVGVIKRIMMSRNSLDIDYIRKMKRPLPEGFILKRVELEDLNSIAEERMIGHIPMFFETPEKFIETGFGFCIRHGDLVVSMASTFAPSGKEFEIEIDTFDSPEYRRKGLATIVGAALIEYALENGLVPHWDAQNEISVELAKKLGYTDPERYEAYYRTKSEGSN